MLENLPSLGCRYIFHKGLQALPAVASSLLLPSRLSALAVTAIGAGLCLEAPPLSKRTWRILTPYMANGLALLSLLRAYRIARDCLSLVSLPSLAMSLMIACLGSLVADACIYPNKPSPNSKRKALMAGSFNPPTNGHLNLLQRLCEEYDEVHAVISLNPSKHYQVSPQVRKKLLEEAITQDPRLERLQISFQNGFAFDYAHEHGIGVLARGVRNQQDSWGENWLKFLNFLSAPDLRTHLLPCLPEFQNVSSSLVRQRLQAGESVDGLVPTPLIQELQDLYGSEA